MNRLLLRISIALFSICLMESGFCAPIAFGSAKKESESFIHVRQNDSLNYAGGYGFGFPFYFREGTVAALEKFYNGKNAAALLTCNRFAAAVRVLKEGLHEGTRTYVGSLRGKIDALEGLAAVYDEQARYKDLRWVYEQIGSEATVEAIHERDYGVVEALFGLGSVLNRRGEYALAEKQYREAINWYNCVGEPQLLSEPWEPKLRHFSDVAAKGHGENTFRIIEMAKLCQRRKHYEEAQGFYQTLLDAFPKQLTYGGSKEFEKEQCIRKAYSIILVSQAELFEELGKLKDAETNYKTALASDEKVLGSNQPGVARDLAGLSCIFRRQGRLAEALQTLSRAISIDEKSLGNHPVVATELINIGELLKESGKKADAKSTFERALKIDRKVYGANHPKVARDLICLERFSEAEDVLRSNLDLAKKFLDAADPHIVSLRKELDNVRHHLMRNER